MSKSDTSILFSSVYAELDVIENVDIDSIAAQIKDIGFECTRCGKCCRGSSGDNRVLLNSEDLRTLEELSLRGDFVVPMLDYPATGSYGKQLVDEKGNLHTFGWMLRRQPDETCVFLEDDSGCQIYASRPLLCRTYPFFLHEGKLEVCECEGLGKPISGDAAKELAIAVIHRKSVELNDTLRVYEKFLEAGIALKEKDVSMEDMVSIVVHDTEGISHFKMRDL